MSKFIEGYYNVKRQWPTKTEDISVGCLCVRSMPIVGGGGVYLVIDIKCTDERAAAINTSTGIHMHLSTSSENVNHCKVWYPVIPHRVP